VDERIHDVIIYNIITNDKSISGKKYGIMPDGVTMHYVVSGLKSSYILATAINSWKKI